MNAVEDTTAPLHRLGRRFKGGTAPDRLAVALLRRLQGACGAQRAEVWLLDTDRRTLWRLAGIGHGRIFASPCPMGVDTRRDPRVARLVARSGRSLRPSILSLGDSVDGDLWAAGLLRVLALPLAAEGDVFALAFAALRSNSLRRPSFHDRALLAGLATACGEVLRASLVRSQQTGRRRRLALLREVSRVVGRQDRLDSLLPRVARAVRQAARCRGVVVGLHHPARSRFEVAGISGPGAGRFRGRQYPFRMRRPIDCLSAIAMGQDEVAHVTDPRPLPRRRSWWAGTRSALAVPIRGRGRVIGVLRLESSRPMAFDEADRDLFAVLGEQVGQAIMRARALDALRRKEAVLRRISGRLRRSLQRERRRIARELHDEIGQAMTAARYNLALLGGWARDAEPPVRRVLRHTERILVRTLREARRIATDLRPADLRGRGFEPALRAAVREFARRTGIEARLRVEEGGLPLGQRAQTLLFRIVQEALTNVARHARARRVGLRLAASSGRLSLTIRDDGIGVRQDHAAGGGLGLAGMRRRVLEHGGEFRLQSAGGRGTLICVTLPARRRRSPGAADSRGPRLAARRLVAEA